MLKHIAVDMIAGTFGRQQIAGPCIVASGSECIPHGARELTSD
jgi:hypothetical protein